jgi:two-component system chemotaxis response regulator CheB
VPNRDIIVIGGSAGGVEALRKLVSSLPPDLKAAVFIVEHIPAWPPSKLPEILSRAGSLPAVHARDGAAIQTGVIYIAPPDHHLIVRQDHVHLERGPKENRHRPAINPLFRSAALAYGPRVIGVILTGSMDDGTLGLWEVKRRGGIAIVQDPAEAPYPDMPRNALQNVEVDYSVPVDEISPLLSTLSAQQIGEQKARETVPKSNSALTSLTCPECRGPIQQQTHGELVEFRCRVGHRYSAETFLAAHAETRERALWAAVVALEEGADVADTLNQSLPAEFQTRLNDEAKINRDLAKQLREITQQLV